MARTLLPEQASSGKDLLTGCFAFLRFIFRRFSQPETACKEGHRQHGVYLPVRPVGKEIAHVVGEDQQPDEGYQ